MKPRIYLALRLLFAVVGLVFLGLALVDALSDPDLTVLPTPAALVAAVLIVVMGLWAAVAGWARLLGVRNRQVARGFLLAQLGKYVPGGVWQVMGQIGDATATTSVGGRGATLAFLSSVVTQVAAGLLVGLPIAFVTATPAWIRLGVLMATAVVLVLLIDQRLLRRVMLALPWIRRQTSADEPMPSRAAMLYSTATSVVAMLAGGVVFAIAYQAPATEFRSTVIPAYALAWTIGFLAVPFPAGLGVREAALLVLVPDGSATALVAASAVVRVIYIVAELVAIATSFIAGTASNAGGAVADDTAPEEGAAGTDGASAPDS